MAEPIKMPFWIWTRVGPRKHVLDGGAHWRHLANTTKPSMCGGDVALCQITLITCNCCMMTMHTATIYKSHTELELELMAIQKNWATEQKIALGQSNTQLSYMREKT